jgi:hypothetical protein
MAHARSGQARRISAVRPAYPQERQRGLNSGRDRNDRSAAKLAVTTTPSLVVRTSHLANRRSSGRRRSHWTRGRCSAQATPTARLRIPVRAGAPTGLAARHSSLVHSPRRRRRGRRNCRSTVGRLEVRWRHHGRCRNTPTLTATIRAGADTLRNPSPWPNSAVSGCLTCGGRPGRECSLFVAGKVGWKTGQTGFRPHESLRAIAPGGLQLNAGTGPSEDRDVGDATPRDRQCGRCLLIPRPPGLSEVPSESNWRSYWDAPNAYRLWALELRAQGSGGRLISNNMQVKLGREKQSSRNWLAGPGAGQDDRGRASTLPAPSCDRCLASGAGTGCCPSGTSSASPNASKPLLR